MLTPLSARQFFQTIQNTKKYQLDLIHFSNELPVDLSLDNCRYCPIWSTRSTKSCSWSTHQKELLFTPLGMILLLLTYRFIIPPIVPLLGTNTQLVSVNLLIFPCDARYCFILAKKYKPLNALPKFHGSVVKAPYIKSSCKIGFMNCGFDTTNTKVNISFSYCWLNFSDRKPNN